MKNTAKACNAASWHENHALGWEWLLPHKRFASTLG